MFPLLQGLPRSLQAKETALLMSSGAISLHSALNTCRLVYLGREVWVHLFQQGANTFRTGPMSYLPCLPTIPTREPSI